MATLQQHTTSNAATITDPSAVEQLLEEYVFVPGAFDHLTARVDERDQDHVVSFRGEAPFAAVPESDIDHHDDRYDPDKEATEAFLTALASHLEEKLTIVTIAHEKYRFPFAANRWTVWPDGTVENQTLDTDPEHPEARAPEERTASVVVESFDEETKCSMCRFRTTAEYRLDDEDEDLGICGGCFAQWLAENDATVSL